MNKTEGGIVQYKPVEWYAWPFFPKCGTVLAGFGGTGKSTLAEQMFIAKLTGGHFGTAEPGVLWEPTRQVNGTPINVVRVARDYPHASQHDPIEERIKRGGGNVAGLTRAAIEDPSLEVLVQRGGFKGHMRDELTELVQDVRQQQSYCVLDPFSVLGGDLNENSNMEVANYVKLFESIPYLGLLHYGKAAMEYERGAARVRGASAWTDVPRHVLVAEVDEETDEVVVTVAKSNIAPTGQHEIRYTLDDGFITHLWTQGASAPKKTPRRTVAQKRGDELEAVFPRVANGVEYAMQQPLCEAAGLAHLTREQRRNAIDAAPRLSRDKAGRVYLTTIVVPFPEQLK